MGTQERAFSEEVRYEIWDVGFMFHCSSAIADRILHIPNSIRLRRVGIAHQYIELDSVHPESLGGHERVSDAEMSNFLRPVPGLSPTPSGRVPGFRKVKEIKGLRRVVLKYAKPEIPQIDAEIAERGHLWMETNWVHTPAQWPEPIQLWPG